jgi:hypothetical protein
MKKTFPFLCLCLLASLEFISCENKRNGTADERFQKKDANNHNDSHNTTPMGGNQQSAGTSGPGELPPNNTDSTRKENSAHAGHNEHKDAEKK